MYIYNVTINIDDSVHDQWLEWMKNTHIPQVMQTGKFMHAKMVKVLLEEEMGGTTYAIQYQVKNKQLLEKYYEEEASRLRQEMDRLFGGKYVAFRTELEVIHQHKVSETTAEQLLFTYGTLQDPTVQKEVFARGLNGSAESLKAYKMANHKVFNSYPTLEFTGNPKDFIDGIAYTVTLEELKLADNYEGPAYVRKRITLQSGKEAWVYLAK